MNDLKFAIRQLLKHKGSSLLAVLILALGIGGTTAVYSVADKVLLNPIPGRDADRLFVLGEVDVLHDFHMGTSPPALDELASQTNVFQSVAAFENFGVEAWLALSEGREKISGARVTPGFFELLGGRPVLGRGFHSGDGLPDSVQTVVASYGLWQQHFGGRPDFVGSTITLDGSRRTVIGVMPSSFQFPFGHGRNQFWIPYSVTEEASADSQFRQVRQWTALVQLRAGVPREQADSLLATLSQRWQVDYPEKERKWMIESKPVRSLFVPEAIERTLWSIQAAVGMLLLIACANVSVLLLARVVARRGEFSIRIAIGAGWSHVARLVMTESIALSAMAGMAGLLFAWGGIHGLKYLYLENLPGLRELGLDWRTFGIALAGALATTVAFGAAPVWFVSRLRPDETLKEGSQRHGGGSLQTTFQDGLVVLQMALAVVLIVGSGLMIQSTVKLLGLDPGLTTKDLYTLHYGVDIINAWKTEVDTTGLTRQEAFQERIREKVRTRMLWQENLLDRLLAYPGIESAAMGDNSEGILNILIDDGDVPFRVRQKEVGIRRGNYFETLQTRLLAGRILNAQDAEPGSDAVVVSREMADQCWPGRSALGGRLSVRDEDFTADFYVVGVVDNVRDWRRDLDPNPTFFVPAERMAEQFLWEPGTGYFVRSGLGAESLRQAAKKAGMEMSPAGDSPNLFSVEQQHARSTAPRRILMWLLVSMGGLGLLLSALGIYAVLAYAVVRRAREVGIRISLGAQRNQVRNLFLGRGLRLAVGGAIFGLVAAFTGARYIESLLFQVSPGDPLSFAGALLVLGSVTLLACWLPARRAARVDPMEALRTE